jgi:hypothetical protein
MPSAGFEPEIAETKRMQTYALDHVATGILHKGLYSMEFKNLTTKVHSTNIQRDINQGTKLMKIYKSRSQWPRGMRRRPP